MRPGGFSSWGRGSATAKTSRQENESQVQNRFAAFSSSGEPSPGPRDAPQTNNYGGRQSDSRNFDNRNNRNSYMGRNSRGPSMDDERQKAIEAVRQGPGGQGPPQRSVTPSHKETPRAAAPSSDLLRGTPNLSYDAVEKLVKPLLDEFLHNCDFNEACICIKEKFHSSTMSLFVELVFTLILERSEKARTQIGGLLKELVKKELLMPSLYQTGLASILSMAEDLLVDIPKLWDFIADILTPTFLEKVLPLSVLRDSAVPLVESKLAGKYAAAVLHCMGKTGHVRVAEMWRENNLQWTSFLSKEQNVEEFVKSNKLEFTLGDGSTATTKNSAMPEDQVRAKITEILASHKSSNEELFDWIDTTMGDRAKSLPFIRTLVTCVAESSIDGIGGPGSQCKLNEEALKLRNPVLKKYLDADLKREMEAIFALQHLMLKLEHPNKLLHSIFDKLYDEEVVSESGFFAWEANEDPAEQEGKGVALKSCTQFFTWLKEAEEEEEDTYCEPERTVNTNAY
jgi:translation initiation factor 4G